MVVHTGDRKGAGTDADIAIRLMGRLDPRCPTRHKLGGSKSDFERASATLHWLLFHLMHLISLM